MAALKLVERLDNDALSDLIEPLARHPYDKIRQRVRQRTARAKQDVNYAPRGGYELVRIPGGEFLMGSPDAEEDRYNKDLERVGWCNTNSGGKLHPIGQKEPNAFSLYDMHGNVWEWT